MDMKKRTRKALTYKIHRFFDQLTMDDIRKAACIVYDNLAIALTALLLFGCIFLLPHLFH